MQNEYETNRTSFAKLGKKYDIPPKRIQAYAKKHGWVKFDLKVLTPSSPLAASSIVTMSSSEIVSSIRSVLGDYYRDIDSVLIYAYVDSYLTMIELKADIAREGRTITSERTGGRYINPSVNLLQAEKNNIVKIGKELGITTTSRIRLGMDIDKHQEGEGLFELVDEIMKITNEELII